MALEMTHAQEVEAGSRFEFGENWTRFLEGMDATRLLAAKESLRSMLGIKTLQGKRFLDIGCGSGLFSLAARSLGAVVNSFDYDPKSVACARELKRRYFDGDPEWTITEGSVLDAGFVGALGLYDVVYSWGVLHHTGEMWRAIALASERVKPGGTLFIAIYNDQGWKSRAWRTVKRIYNRIPKALGLRSAFAAISFTMIYGLFSLKYLVLLRPSVVTSLFRRYREKSLRGMSLYTDWLDWIGGYPFEVASLEELAEYLKNSGFSMVRANRATSLGCHELVVVRDR